MIEKRNFLIAKCDKCKEYFGSEDVEFYVFHDLKELLETLQISGWIIKNKKFTCTECQAEQELLKKQAGEKE
ncbi:MAG TPA: hypothetical protein VMW25_02640 [Clostridia bacterium]|nr:hypothetical protein [Clostridia bacterium]